MLRALPSHSGESMTMLWFLWRPGDCMLTFGPGNSLQLLGTSAKLLLILRGENGRKPPAVSETGSAAHSELQGKLARRPTAEMQKAQHDLQPREADMNRPP